MKFINAVIIEDNPKDAEILCYYLKKIKDYKVNHKTFETMAEGRGYIYDHPKNVDIIFLDLNLPDSEAKETITVELGHLSNYPVIVLTSLDFDIGYEAIKMGASDFINKDTLANERIEYKILFAIERKRQFENLRKMSLYDQDYSVYSLVFINNMFKTVSSEQKNAKLIRLTLDESDIEEFKNNIHYVINHIKHLEVFWDTYIAIDMKRQLFILSLEDENGELEIIAEINKSMKEVEGANRNIIYQIKEIDLVSGESLIDRFQDLNDRGDDGAF